MEVWEPCTQFLTGLFRSDSLTVASLMSGARSAPREFGFLLLEGKPTSSGSKITKILLFWSKLAFCLTNGLNCRGRPLVFRYKSWISTTCTILKKCSRMLTLLELVQALVHLSAQIRKSSGICDVINSTRYGV